MGDPDWNKSWTLHQSGFRVGFVKRRNVQGNFFLGDPESFALALRLIIFGAMMIVSSALVRSSMFSFLAILLMGAESLRAPRAAGSNIIGSWPSLGERYQEEEQTYIC